MRVRVSCGGTVKMVYLMLTCRVLLAGVFATALVGKVRGRAALDEFVASIVALGVLPRPVSVVAAYAVLTAEAAVILLLALPSALFLGFAAATVLLAVLTAGISAAMRRGRRAPCRCFGASATPLGRTHVVRNLILMAVGCIGLAAEVAARTTPAGSAAHPAGVALAVATAAVGVLLVVRLDDLTSLFTASVSPR
ncbi:MauE/DoxX family redox-associated membrane protein [Streptosporangium sp. 'caverna']|uniref:MauE/DoxX family redox-associated membrane protein n=1 Tax=Streptosporangium sp. 'caverna' TaxID=2202249 RepID=UPI000D7D74B0|nr:MauE/DoxX family redox-associated membrane protein [Streptosporangium sp. 'caverna']AWS43112.1 methylamine utilization protein MauE [Streptosporangium sp. 'caverna']